MLGCFQVALDTERSPSILDQSFHHHYRPGGVRSLGAAEAGGAIFCSVGQNLGVSTLPTELEGRRSRRPVIEAKHSSFVGHGRSSGRCKRLPSKSKTVFKVLNETGRASNLPSFQFSIRCRSRRCETGSEPSPSYRLQISPPKLLRGPGFFRRLNKRIRKVVDVLIHEKSGHCVV